MLRKLVFIVLVMGVIFGASRLVGSLVGSLVKPLFFSQTTPDTVLPAMTVYPSEQIREQADQQAFVQLLSQSGEELYSAALPGKGAGSSQVFDMNDLKDGTYTIRISQGNRMVVRSIKLSTSAPERLN